MVEQSGQKLCKKKQENELSNFNSNQIKELDIEEIQNHEKALNKAGIFSFLFSQEYKEAKNFYKNIDIGGKFKKSHAQKKLKKLSSWRTDVKNFEKEEQIKKILGDKFDGIDTNFIPFTSAIEYFNKINKSFPKSSYSELNDFLKFGDHEEIEKLFAIGKNTSLQKIKKSMQMVKLNEEISALKVSLETCEFDIKENKKT